MNYNFEQSMINGVGYTNALVLSANQSQGEIQIAAERAYTHFTGQLGIPDDQPSQAEFMVSISLDNSAPVISTVVHFGTTTPLSINVTGVLRIEIYVTETMNCCDNVAIGDPTLS